MRPPSGRGPWLDRTVALALGLVCAATRFAVRGHGLFSWDSGLLASGIVSYDFSAGHPHPPYYPLAIAFAKPLAWWTTPAQALVLESVAASGVLAAFTYLAGRGFLGRPASLLAAALVVLSPTALFNGSVALTYAAEGASSAVVGWAAWRCRTAPGRLRAVALAVALSVAIGIRPSSLFLLAPLGLWAVWGSWRRLGDAVVAGGVATAAWAVPMLLAGGGLWDFLSGNRYQSSHVVFRHPVWREGWSVVPENLDRLASYVPRELPFLAAFMAVTVVTALLWLPRRPARPSGALLSIWFLPGFAFFVLVYAGWPVFPSGYLMVLLPPVALGIGYVVEGLLHGLRDVQPGRTAEALAAIAAVALLAMPVTWAGAWPEATRPQRDVDAYGAAWWALERDYPANETALVTFTGLFWATLEHPHYLTWGVLPFWNATDEVRVQVLQVQDGHADREAYADALDGDDYNPPHPIPPWVRHVVLIQGPPIEVRFEPFKPGLPVQNLTLESGMRVSVLDPSGLSSIEQAIVWFDDEGRLLP